MWNCFDSEYIVHALRAVQTSRPNDTKHVLVTRGPIFISGKYGSRGSYIEQINP